MMKGIYLLSLVVLMVSGCSYIRMHGGMTDDYLNEPQPIDYYVRPNLSPNAIVHDWVVCGGSVYGFYNWNFLNREYDINRYSKEITKCLEKNSGVIDNAICLQYITNHYFAKSMV